MHFNGNANNTEEYTRLCELSNVYSRRLHKLKVQAAAYGIDCPPHITNEIEDIEKNLAELEEQLNGNQLPYTEANNKLEKLNQDIENINNKLQIELNQFKLFGYIYVENKGEAEILVRQEENKYGTIIYKFPDMITFDPTQITIEKAIDNAVQKYINDFGINRRDFQKAGFSTPVFRQLYSVATESINGVFTRKAIPEPYIFFKIRLYNKIGREDCWAKKLDASKQWQSTISNGVKEDLFRRLMKPWISNEVDFIILEHVDVFLFRLVEQKDIEFFMFRRRDEAAKAKVWEYIKGELLYHETPFEGALREISNKISVSRKKLRYCGYLGWQTINAENRNESYDTLRTHGLVIQFLGEDNDFEIDKIHDRCRWVPIEEAKDMAWMEEYAKEFFNRWDTTQPCLLHRANVLPDTGVENWQCY